MGRELERCQATGSGVPEHAAEGVEHAMKAMAVAGNQAVLAEDQAHQAIGALADRQVGFTLLRLAGPAVGDQGGQGNGEDPGMGEGDDAIADVRQP